VKNPFSIRASILWKIKIRSWSNSVTEIKIDMAMPMMERVYGQGSSPINLFAWQIFFQRNSRKAGI
jgi:hypothetical protein